MISNQKPCLPQGFWFFRRQLPVSFYQFLGMLLEFGFRRFLSLFYPKSSANLAATPI